MIVDPVDATWKSNPKTTTIRVDRTAPSVTLSGTLKDNENRELRSDPQYGLRIEAVDCSSAGSRSGIRSVEIKVDGARKDYEERGGDTGPCALERDWLFDLAQYAPGPHTVSVEVVDFAGNRFATSWMVTVNRTPPACGAPNHSVYDLDPAFSTVTGLRMSETELFCEPYDLEMGRSTGVAFDYGTCEVTAYDPVHPDDPGGCMPPIQVQSVPLCERHAALYTTGVEEPEPYPRQDLVIRGVPAASFNGGAIIEVYTGNTTISVEGENTTQVLAAANAVRLAPAYGPTGQPPPTPLPMPNQATLNSTQECTS